MDAGIEFPYEFPLLFQVISNVDKSIIYESQMFPGYWASLINDHPVSVLYKIKKKVK